MYDVAALPFTAAEKVAAFQAGRGCSEAYALATVVRTVGASACRPGDRFIVTGEGELIGVTGGGCMRGAVRKAGLAAMAEGAPRHIRVLPRDRADAPAEEGIELYGSACPSRGEIDLFIEPIQPAPRLYVLGETEIAEDVAAFARAAGFDVRAVQGSATTLDAQVSAVVAGPFAVVATQGQGDKAGLEAAMASGCTHILFVASRKKGEHWRAALAEGGVSEERLGALIAPAGLDIGAHGAAEIAMSIVAQLIALRRKGASA